jgi:ATP-dependent helicase/nuclease subunit A
MEGTPRRDKMAGLTEQQKKALNLDRHISVTANAGSGKTRVLTERYVEAVKMGVGVEQILCLTFTEKAALELKEKIGTRINSGIAEEKKSGGSHLKVLRDARRKMLQANISTIHSFCSQVLREFPVEAGIDANFKVLEDFDSATLKEESCDRAVREALAEERESHGNVYNLLVRLGYRRTLSLLIDLLDSREKIEHIKIRGHKLLMDEQTVREHWRKLSEAVVGVARENVRLKKGDLSDEIREIESALKAGGDVLNSLAGLLQKILTKEGTPRKREVAIVDGSTYSWEAALSILETVYESVADLPSDRKKVSDYLLLLQTLMNLFEKSLEHYRRKKYSMSALDFDDLQIATMHLLRKNESVRSALTSRFKHIMVDEFQDTNFLQYDIFLNLIDSFSGDTKLFVVGDPKQSIYRFRNAQVEVSIETEKEISGLKNGSAVPLLESFRMNEELASFVNEVFSKAMSTDKVPDIPGLPSSIQTVYNPLTARRPNGVEPAVEIFLSHSNKQDEGSDNDLSVGTTSELSPTEQQALFVASRISEMVNGGETVRDVKLNEESREIKYGDIAILLRSRSRLEAIEAALNEKGVPYSVTSGIGFYSAQEIFDLTNYLTFLLDNNADISLLTVIRSPFFGISEDELFRISRCEGDTFFEKFQAFAEMENASDEVKYAAAVLNDEIQLAHRFTIPQLINRILERTGWLGAYRLSATGEQRIANMRKLLSIAREFEGRGFNNLYDFVERLKYLKGTAREGQAVVEETADVVKIMTVHAAKGLEFPVVIVPFCDATTNRRSNLIVNDRAGVLPFISNEVPAELSLYQRLEKQNEQAEITRLFYVACTRAMDRLILTAAPKKTSSRDVNSFADIISKSFDISSPPESRHYEYAGGRVRVVNEIPIVNGEEENRKLETEGKRDETASPKIFLDPIPADIDGEIYSATVLQTFKLCPTKYFLRYRIGMPAPETGNGRQEAGNCLDEYDDSILATVKGEIIHAVLEDILSRHSYDDAEIVNAAGQAVSSHFGNSLGKEESEKLVSQVVENSKNAIATLRSVSKLDKLYREETITRKFGSDYLTGTLDLLVEDEKGFHVFDYKTNRLGRGLEKIYSDYEIQMKFYASLCSRLKPGQESFDVTIIFTREEGKYLTKSYSRKEIEDFENDLEAMIQKIKSIEPSVGFYPTANDESLPTSMPHCDECEYYVGEVKKECLLKRK